MILPPFYPVSHKKLKKFENIFFSLRFTLKAPENVPRQDNR